MSSNMGDASFGKAKGAGEHTCIFQCFDTIGRLVCCYCGALARPESLVDLVERGLEDIKAGRYRPIDVGKW